MARKKRIYGVLTAYIVLFYAVWAVFELLVKHRIDDVITNEILAQLVKSGVIKNLVWTLPALLLAKRYSDEMYVKSEEIFTTKVNWLKYLTIFAAFTVYLLVGSIVQRGKIGISETFGITDIIIFLFVGITEEAVFRGWLLNATLRPGREWLAVAVNAVMFLLIHFPAWVYEGKLVQNFASLSFVSVLVLSVIFSWTFIKSRNLIVPILLHMYWDLLMFMLY